MNILIQQRSEAKKTPWRFCYFNLLYHKMAWPMEKIRETFWNRMQTVPDNLAEKRRQVFDGILIKSQWE